MSILLEVLTASLSAGLGYSFPLIKKKLVKPKECALGSIEWRWFNSDVSVHRGYRCPKCLSTGCNQKDYKFCSCEEFPRGHFHFICNSCTFTAIMRPKGEPGC
jgi:hypothetical protein